MALPRINPIDAGWLPRNISIDHMGTSTISCPVCDTRVKAEQYKFIVGGSFGFGAPWFIAPFLKRRSTLGKVGGKRLIAHQCCTCTSMFAGNPAAVEWFSASGAADGCMSTASALKMMNNQLGADERASGETFTPKTDSTRAQKIED